MFLALRIDYISMQSWIAVFPRFGITNPAVACIHLSSDVTEQEIQVCIPNGCFINIIM